jgi:alpha-D-ribose 1-methylphosphonate 5-triphosphate synthase subunit PhnH
MISTLSKKHSFDLVFDTQRVFRLILEAMSNPTRIVNIRQCASALFGDQPTFLALAITLLDNEVSFNTCENHALTAEIESLTLTKKAGLEYADYVFVSNPNKIKDVIERINCGTLADPHKSATLIIRNDGEPGCLLKLSGPGIDGQAEVRVSKTVSETLQLRDEQNYEYPQGIDIIFVSSSGDLLAIPRLVAC